MSIKVMTQVWDSSTAKGSHLLMLLAIADFADDDGYAFPNTATLAKKIRMSEPSVKRIRKDLYDSGELAYVSGGKYRGDRLIVQVTIKGIKMIPLDDGRVSGDAQKGIKSNALRVSPVIPDPSLDPPIEPSKDKESEWTPDLSAQPLPTPAPTPASSKKHYKRVTSKDFDPRKIGADGLIAEGKGSTPLEVYCEFSANHPGAAHRREMAKIDNADLDKWRAHVRDCIVSRSFRTAGPVMDTFINGFRDNGKNNGNAKQGRIFDAKPTASNGTIARPAECPAGVWDSLRDSQRRAMVTAEPGQRRIFVERQQQRIADQQAGV